MRHLLVLVLALLAAAPGRAQTADETEETILSETMVDPAAEAAFRDWISAFRPQALAAGVPAAVYDREMRTAQRLPGVVALDRNQSEFTRTIWDYLDRAVSEERVAQGRAALAQHAALFRQISAEYGVDAEVVAAIWGLETAYGTQRGSIDTISALATLAQDGRRAAFFGAELVQALQILAGGHVPRAAMRGSWAGAMGHPQFMPSSWAKHAVDADGDGRRDIWGDDPADALASAAAYLRAAGWGAGQPWGLEVRLPPGFDLALADGQVTRPVADWQAAGVRPVAGGDLPDGPPAQIRLPAGAAGPALMVFPNFAVIGSYNRAEAYMIAVGHLSDRLRGGGPLVQPWPREGRALTVAERRALQQALTAAGYLAPGGVDGQLGPRSLAALRAWQTDQGRIPDGYPSPDVLEAVLADAASRGALPPPRP